MSSTLQNGWYSTRDRNNPSQLLVALNHLRWIIYHCKIKHYVDSHLSQLTSKILHLEVWFRWKRYPTNENQKISRTSYHLASNCISQMCCHTIHTLADCKRWRSFHLAKYQEAMFDHHCLVTFSFRKGVWCDHTHITFQSNSYIPLIDEHSSLSLCWQRNPKIRTEAFIVRINVE